MVNTDGRGIPDAENTHNAIIVSHANTWKPASRRMPACVHMERAMHRDEFSGLHDAPLIAAYGGYHTVPCIHAE